MVAEVQNLEEVPESDGPEEDVREVFATRCEKRAPASHGDEAIEKKNVAPPGEGVKGLCDEADVTPEPPEGDGEARRAEKDESLAHISILHGLDVVEL